MNTFINHLYFDVCVKISSGLEILTVENEAKTKNDE